MTVGNQIEQNAPGVPDASDPRLAELTPREREVLTFIGHGYSIAEIAKHMNRGYATVKSHRLMLGRKLNVSNRVELARIAMETGLSPLSHDQGNHLTDDIVTSDDALEILQRIEAGTAHCAGEAYFPALVKHLAEALNVLSVVLRALKPDSPARISTLAVWKDGAPAVNFEFELRGTPSEQAIRQGLQFSQTKLIPGSHTCTALLSNSGRPIGILTIIHDEPMKSTFELQALLRIFAARATIEILQLRLKSQSGV